MNFRPLHDRVVVKRLTAEEKTAGGIIIPDTAQEKPMDGEIIADGTHAELLQTCPEYVQIYDSQESTEQYELQA